MLEVPCQPTPMQPRVTLLLGATAAPLPSTVLGTILGNPTVAVKRAVDPMRKSRRFRLFFLAIVEPFQRMDHMRKPDVMSPALDAHAGHLADGGLIPWTLVSIERNLSREVTKSVLNSGPPKHQVRSIRYGYASDVFGRRRVNLYAGASAADVEVAMNIQGHAVRSGAPNPESNAAHWSISPGSSRRTCRSPCPCCQPDTGSCRPVTGLPRWA